MFNYFKTYNLNDFLAKGIPAFDYQYDFEGLGIKTVTALKGARNNVMIDDVMITIELNAMNPFEFEGRGVYLDGQMNVWIGIDYVDQD